MSDGGGEGGLIGYWVIGCEWEEERLRVGRRGKLGAVRDSLE